MILFLQYVLSFYDFFEIVNQLNNYFKFLFRMACLLCLFFFIFILEKVMIENLTFINTSKFDKINRLSEYDEKFKNLLK